MLVLVVSDLHLGKGRFFKNGQLNILEDFFEDDRFEEFVEYYSSGKNYWSNVHLVLNGDIVNLIQIDINGVFNHIIDEEWAVKTLDSVVNGHPNFFNVLKRFLSHPNKQLSYLIGNHDPGMAFKKAQDRFREIVGGKVDFSFELNLYGVHIEHGQRFEVHNYIPRDNYFVPGPNGKRIINLPWGGLFCASLLPQLRKERPNIDKIRPKSVYIKWLIFHDFSFALRMGLMVFKYFLKTNLTLYARKNRNFKTTLRYLRQGLIYPRYVKMAKKILAANPLLHTVIMGHTHIAEWRRFPEGKYYFNSGTWNPVPSVDAGLHESISQLHYVTVDIHTKSGIVKSASLNTWKGKWRPFREEVNANFLQTKK